MSKDWEEKMGKNNKKRRDKNGTGIGYSEVISLRDRVNNAAETHGKGAVEIAFGGLWAKFERVVANTEAHHDAPDQNPIPPEERTFSKSDYVTMEKALGALTGKQGSKKEKRGNKYAHFSRATDRDHNDGMA